MVLINIVLYLKIEQFLWLYIQSFRNLIYGIDGNIDFSLFDLIEICMIDIASLGQFPKTQIFGFPYLF